MSPDSLMCDWRCECGKFMKIECFKYIMCLGRAKCRANINDVLSLSS